MRILGTTALLAISGSTAAPPVQAAADPAFDAAISRVESMVQDNRVNNLVQMRGLKVLNVTWEDTGRFKGSVWGPNISDMTIGVRDSRGRLHPMPVIRFDNFSDITADLPSDRLQVLVGNESGRDLHPVSVADLLKDLRGFLHDPQSWRGWRRSLWASRDSRVLLSAQACFLPVPRHGEATFTPVIYNYQSYPGNPAVLTMVATREGTSIQVVENESGYMSEVLYFNEDGQRAPFTAVRQSERSWYQGVDDSHIPEAGGQRGASDDGLNVVLLVQVPLKQKEKRSWLAFEAPMDSTAGSRACAKPMVLPRSDVEDAVIGHGATEGPFEEIGDLEIQRDPRYPVRVTVQFYKATSNGVVDPSDIAAIRSRIDRVYQHGDYVGSLVLSGWTGRPTEWYGQPESSETADWAEPPWQWMKGW